MGGWAPRYDPGGMERVAFNRDLPIASCMVSSPYYDIGEMVYVYGRNTGALRWCRVTDVSKPEHRARHRRIGWVIEAGYNEAVSLCGIEHINDPPKKCPVIVFRVNDG